MTSKLVILGNKRNTDNIGLLEDGNLKLNFHIVDRVNYHQFDLFNDNSCDIYDLPSTKERDSMLYDIYQNFNSHGVSNFYVDWRSCYIREDYNETYMKDIVLNSDKSFYSCSLWEHREKDISAFSEYGGEVLIDYPVAYAQFEKLLAAD